MLSVVKSFCTNCRDNQGKSNETTDKTEIRSDVSVNDVCETCGYASGLRPDIVWFGEMPYAMNEIADALRECDLFISIGTSGNVYPAAGFVQEALFSSAHTIEINLDPAQNSSNFHDSILGKAGDTMPKLVEHLLA